MVYKPRGKTRISGKPRSKSLTRRQIRSRKCRSRRQNRVERRSRKRARKRQRGGTVGKNKRPRAPMPHFGRAPPPINATLRYRHLKRVRDAAAEFNATHPYPFDVKLTRAEKLKERAGELIGTDEIFGFRLAPADITRMSPRAAHNIKTGKPLKKVKFDPKIPSEEPGFSQPD